MPLPLLGKGGLYYAERMFSQSLLWVYHRLKPWYYSLSLLLLITLFLDEYGLSQGGKLADVDAVTPESKGSESFSVWSVVGRPILHGFQFFLPRLIKDWWTIHLNLFEKETMWAMLMGSMVYLAVRYGENKSGRRFTKFILSPLDEWIHSFFYTEGSMEHTPRFNSVVVDLGHVGFKLERIVLLFVAVFFGDPKQRIAVWFFMEGSLGIAVAKDSIKQLINQWHWSGAERPESELFDPRTVYYGGFPSGHIAQSAFAVAFTYLVWQAYPVVWIGFAFQAVASFLWAIDSNRHYASQIIVGIALGVVYAVAAAHSHGFVVE